MTNPIGDGLAHSDPRERSRACRSAADDPSAVLFVDALCLALGDEDRSVARAASDALCVLASRHAEVVRTLRTTLRSDLRRARFAAAFSLARLGPPEPRLIPAVVEALGDADSDVRWAAARMLVEVGRLHAEAAGLPLALLRGDDTPSPRVRRMAAHCLRELGADDTQSVDGLLEACEAEDLELRRAAYSAIAALARVEAGREPDPRALARLAWAREHEGDPGCQRLASFGLRKLREAEASNRS